MANMEKDVEKSLGRRTWSSFVEHLGIIESQGSNQQIRKKKCRKITYICISLPVKKSYTVENRQHHLIKVSYFQNNFGFHDKVHDKVHK